MNKKQIINYLVTFAMGIIFGIVLTASRREIFEPGFQGTCRAVSDGFFVASIFMISMGILILIADAGNFYGISYLIYTIGTLITISNNKFEDRAKKDFYTYKTEKEAKRRDSSNLADRLRILITGAILLVIAVVATVLYYI